MTYCSVIYQGMYDVAEGGCPPAMAYMYMYLVLNTFVLSYTECYQLRAESYVY